MLLKWTVLTVLPCLVVSASLRESLLLDRTTRDVSPAEDPPPMVFYHRKFIPSIERLYKNGYPSSLDFEPVEDNQNYQNIDTLTDNVDFLPSNQVFAARRSNLKQYSFTMEPVDRIERDATQQVQSRRRHKAMNFPENEQKRRSKRGASSPAVDAVDENPAQWRRFDNKPQFVTSRTQPPTAARNNYPGVPQHRVAHSMDENDVHNMRFNEIPPPAREQSRYVPGSYTREPIVDYRREEPPRRIIYYANLPEDSRGGPVTPVDYRRDRPNYDDRYDYGRSFMKYPRESRYEENPVRQPVRDDQYRYAPPRSGSSYTIIDAERPPPPYNNYPPSAPAQYPYRDPDTVSRYNRIPAPYQQSQSGGRYTYDQRRGTPPPPTGPDRPNAALHPSRYNPYGRSGGNLPRNQLTVTPSSPIGDELYRDYNPRQPAPWSLQIGTKLTVKDDGRPMPSPGGQRFYVQSQQPQYPSRYLRSEDDPDTRQS